MTEIRGGLVMGFGGSGATGIPMTSMPAGMPVPPVPTPGTHCGQGGSSCVTDGSGPRFVVTGIEGGTVNGCITGSTDVLPELCEALSGAAGESEIDTGRGAKSRRGRRSGRNNGMKNATATAVACMAKDVKVAHPRRGLDTVES